MVSTKRQGKQRYEHPSIDVFLPNIVFCCPCFVLVSASKEFFLYDHPYKPDTACRWRIVGPRQARMFIKILKMDIEEERPSDSATCGHPGNPAHRPCRPGENEHCEWDHLRFIIGGKSTRKMCMYVNKFKRFAVQANVP